MIVLTVQLRSVQVYNSCNIGPIHTTKKLKAILKVYNDFLWKMSFSIIVAIKQKTVTQTFSL